MIYSPRFEAKDFRVDSPRSSPMRSVTVADSLEAFTESRFTTVTGIPIGHSERDFTSLTWVCETAQGVEPFWTTPAVETLANKLWRKGKISRSILISRT